MANPTPSIRGERFSTAVVEAVAQRVGAEPADLDPPLFAAVDPDALDEVLASMESVGPGGSVSFHYRGFEVTVHADGDVDLQRSSDPSPGSESGSIPADE
jgi:hypothetical protein